MANAINGAATASLPDTLTTSGIATDQIRRSGSKRSGDGGGGGSSGSKRRRRLELGYGTDSGAYLDTEPSTLIIHEKLAYPTSAPNATAVTFSIQASFNEIIR